MHSTDTGVEKMNPLTAHIFDSDHGVVSTQLLDMCMYSSSTAEGIFPKMKEALSKHDIPWDNCVGIGLDNTSVNMGCTNSIKTISVIGCPCHIVHNIAGKSWRSI